MATYPGGIKNFLQLEDGVDTVLAQHMNERGDEITALETELGADVAGSAADLVTRLAAGLNDDGTLKEETLTSFSGITDPSGSKNIFNRITYEGNGTDDRNIAHGLGRTPELVILTRDPGDGGNDTLIWMSGMASTYCMDATDGGAKTNFIQAVGDTYVQVGSNANVNANGSTYVMFVM